MANAGSLNQHPSFAGNSTLALIDQKLEKIRRLGRFFKHQRSMALFNVFLRLMSIDLIGRHITSFLVSTKVSHECGEQYDLNDSAKNLQNFLSLFSNLYGFSDLFPLFLDLFSRYIHIPMMYSGYSINANVHFFRKPCHKRADSGIWGDWKDRNRCKRKCTSSRPCYHRFPPPERAYVDRLIEHGEQLHSLNWFFLSGCLSGELFDKALRSFLMSVPPPRLSDACSSKYLKNFLNGNSLKKLKHPFKVPSNFLQMVLLSYLKGTHSLILFLLSFDINGEVFNQDDYYWAHGRVHLKKGRDQTISFERLFQFCRKIIGTFSHVYLPYFDFGLDGKYDDEDGYEFLMPFNIFLFHVMNMPPFLSILAKNTLNEKQCNQFWGEWNPSDCMIALLKMSKARFKTHTGKTWKFVDAQAQIPNDPCHMSHIFDINIDNIEENSDDTYAEYFDDVNLVGRKKEITYFFK
jgi:hypothetical protein